jgi:hypothetical protein
LPCGRILGQGADGQSGREKDERDAVAPGDAMAHGTLLVLHQGYSNAVFPIKPLCCRSRVEAAADARRQRAKLYFEYGEPFATKQMRLDRLARRVKTPILGLQILKKNAAFS